MDTQSKSDRVTEDRAFLRREANTWLGTARIERASGFPRHARKCYVLALACLRASHGTLDRDRVPMLDDDGTHDRRWWHD